MQFDKKLLADIDDYIQGGGCMSVPQELFADFFKQACEDPASIQLLSLLEKAKSSQSDDDLAEVDTYWEGSVFPSFNG